MPTVATMPTLEATQAVGAILLHQFARERFVEAGIDESLLREAEEREHLDVLASTLITDGGDQQCDANNTTNNTSHCCSTPTRNTSLQSNGANTTMRSELNNGTLNNTEHFHSMTESSLVVNGTRTEGDRTIYHSMNTSNQSVSPLDRIPESSCLASYGRELRRIAEEFEKSRLRKTVKDRAGQVNLTDITKESFVKLLEELFQEKITREKIVILFFFCTDVALRAASFAQDLVVKLLGWSFSYIINTVCSFVHKLGGWDKVLFYQLPSLLISCCAVLAMFSLFVYLKRSLRD